MSTTMHRLQISLPEWQTQFLAERARRDGISIAEVVRRLVRREADAAASARTTDSLWEIAGIARDDGPLLDDVAVSEDPDRYLAAALEARTTKRPSRRARRTGT